MRAGIVYYRPEGDLIWLGRYDRVIRVPAGLWRKEELLETLATEMKFPSYFGGNWDALQDCLSDLSWLPEGRTLILHEDLPLAAQPQEAGIYVDVLFEALASWQGEGDKGRLEAAFPEAVRDLVEPLGK